MKRVLFVCLGNICRSPTGEGILKRMLADRGLEDRIGVDSAGTSGWHIGEPADERMQEAASRRGYLLESRGRRFVWEDFDRFDLIVAMDRQNLADILSLRPGPAQAAKVRLLCDFLPESSTRDVPDPYYGGRQGFDRVIDMIEEACANLLEELS